MSEENDGASELDHREEVFWVVFFRSIFKLLITSAALSSLSISNKVGSPIG
jgi:hypothetical protein